MQHAATIPTADSTDTTTDTTTATTEPAAHDDDDDDDDESPYDRTFRPRMDPITSYFC